MQLKIKKNSVPKLSINFCSAFTGTEGITVFNLFIQFSDKFLFLSLFLIFIAWNSTIARLPGRELIPPGNKLRHGYRLWRISFSREELVKGFSPLQPCALGQRAQFALSPSQCCSWRQSSLHILSLSSLNDRQFCLTVFTFTKVSVLWMYRKAHLDMGSSLLLLRLGSLKTMSEIQIFSRIRISWVLCYKLYIFFKFKRLFFRNGYFLKGIISHSIFAECLRALAAFAGAEYMSVPDTIGTHSTIPKTLRRIKSCIKEGWVGSNFSFWTTWKRKKVRTRGERAENFYEYKHENKSLAVSLK